jgi:hypothetical protein
MDLSRGLGDVYKRQGQIFFILHLQLEAPGSVAQLDRATAF